MIVSLSTFISGYLAIGGVLSQFGGIFAQTLPLASALGAFIGTIIAHSIGSNADIRTNLKSDIYMAIQAAVCAGAISFMMEAILSVVLPGSGASRFVLPLLTAIGVYMFC